MPERRLSCAFGTAHPPEVKLTQSNTNLQRTAPEDMEYAVQTVMTQCEQWADNTDMETPDLQEPKVLKYSFVSEENLSKVAEEHLPYGRKK